MKGCVLTCDARFIFIMARLLFREEFEEAIWKIMEWQEEASKQR